MFLVGWSTTRQSVPNPASLSLESLAVQLLPTSPTGTLRHVTGSEGRHRPLPQGQAKALTENANRRGLWLLSQAPAFSAMPASAETSRDFRRQADTRECGNTPQHGQTKGFPVVRS